MKCPCGAGDLIKQTYEATVEVEQCAACGGTWLDEGELSTIQESRERDHSQISRQLNLAAKAFEMAFAKAKPAVHCPKCAQELDRREYMGYTQTMIDVCARCRGIWLDKGELEFLEVCFEGAANEAHADFKKEQQLEARSGFFASLASLFD